eukprot:scaffold302745_cov19-Prasinocladus_malaysianus.AAC.1
MSTEKQHKAANNMIYIPETFQKLASPQGVVMTERIQLIQKAFFLLSPEYSRSRLLTVYKILNLNNVDAMTKERQGASYVFVVSKRPV